MKKRGFWIFILFLSMTALSLNSVFRHPWTSLNECLKRPERYDGREVNQFREPVIGEIFPDGFTLLQKQGPSIRVVCDTAGLIRGEYVGIKAVFHKQGYLDRAVLQVAQKRREKMGISIIPVLIVTGLLCYHFRWNARKRWFEKRDHA